MDHPDHFQRYTIANIGKAPTVPGLYAWYGVIVAGAPDWEMDLYEGQDRGELNSRRVLKNHTARYRGPELEITAAGGFSTAWQGNIQDSSNRGLQEVLEAMIATPSEGDSVPAPKLQQTLSSPDARKLLFRALSASNPVFAAPLYIGVAEDLANRLRQHSKMLLKLWEACAKDASRLQQIRENPKFKGQFAVRAIERGFSPESVEVWVLPLEHFNEDNLNDTQLRTTAEALEWLLNRWHRPPLGRR